MRDTTSSALGIRRFFTTKGIHPYDELEWEKRDAKIQNYTDGSVAFEQKGVEFPTNFSQNATNIVAQKYFYGTPGEPEREQSVKELINRVVDTITNYGLENNYFVDEEEAETFNHELKHLTATQKAAFNSPVWFNIGAPDRKQQASACFILHVEDTMESILNWYYEEGMIFKGGSGAGAYLGRLRSSYEGLSNSDGHASGPTSFMRGADAIAGTIKSGGKTRRAAKMVILNVDHPDIEEFIWCKAIEERKMRVLDEAGYDMDLDGADSFSVQYQNANQSVRVTDEFMEAVENDEDWDLNAVTTGETIKTVSARNLMRQIAEAAWECADPGMQYHTTINHWNTVANSGEIVGSNPCSEYMHIDNTACNLASINLLKFLNEDGSFDVAAFKQAVEIIFTAQEILVGYSDYPTETIGENARKFRELGIGYANLGAMLMAMGLPYDSDGGRAIAGAITALETGHAYATSAKIANRIGPFEGYEKNEGPMLKVLRQHREAVSDIDPKLVPEDLMSAAQAAWDDAVELGQRHGVRNSQASVLAPTGTIGLMMDCDTTGIEPDLGLVKVKKLVGGGTMNIVNQTVPRALRNLGYDSEQVEEIIDYIDEEKTIIGAPYVEEEHLPVFACAMGEENVIHYNGHIRMMGAVQPFISGAISKTVNLPASVTVDDIEQAYIDSWKLGLKAVAIYREGSKHGQPLSGAKKDDEEEEPEQPVDSSQETADEEGQAVNEQSSTASKPQAAVSASAQQTTSQQPTEGPVSEAEAEGKQFVVKGPVRKQPPMQRTSKTYKFRVADCKGYFTVGEYEDGRPAEIFINVAKQGSTLSGLMDSFAISVSQGLQYGVPLKRYVKTFTHTSFAPAGITSDSEIQYASSLMDYIFRRIALDYLSAQDRRDLGLVRSGEEAENSQQTELISEEEIDSGSEELAEEPAGNPSTEANPGADTDAKSEDMYVVERSAPTDTGSSEQGSIKLGSETAPLCTNCGNRMQRSGSCHVCPGCGETSGCS